MGYTFEMKIRMSIDLDVKWPWEIRLIMIIQFSIWDFVILLQIGKNRTEFCDIIKKKKRRTSEFFCNHGIAQSCWNCIEKSTPQYDSVLQMPGSLLKISELV